MGGAPRGRGVVEVKEIHHGLKMCTQSAVMCVFNNDRVTDVVLVSTG